MPGPEVREWILKAEGDFGTAMREFRARENPNYDAICFHAQQCAEKYLKGLIEFLGGPLARTHDLVVLLDVCSDRFPLLALWRDELELLTQYAVLFRYPGESAEKPDAKAAIKVIKPFREELRSILRV